MSRSEYMKDYKKQSKLQELKDELEKTILENTWYDPNRNFYLKPILLTDLPRWNQETEKRFNLQYDIEHYYEKGKNYLGERKEAFRKHQLEEDLIHRIIKWRLFCKAIHLRKGRLPTHTEAVFNNVHKPDVEDRPDLLHLFVIQEDDPIIEVTTAEDWAAEDEYLDFLESIGIFL